MSLIELLLGFFIVTALGIGAIVAAEPFFGPRRPRARGVVLRVGACAQEEEARASGSRRAA